MNDSVNLNISFENEKITLRMLCSSIFFNAVESFAKEDEK